MVESQMDDTPVYSVVQMTPGSTSRILHQNMFHPLELIHVDFLLIGGKKDVRKDINVLVVTDHFTQYAQAYVTNS